MKITFGYTLRLVKNKYIKQEQMFVRVVPMLEKEVKEFKAWLLNDMDLSRDSVNALSTHIENLHSLIDIYYKNIFSAPSCGFLMMNNMDKIRNKGSEFVSICEDANRLKVFSSRRRVYDNVLEQESIDEADTLIDRGIKLVQKGINDVVYVIISCLDLIHITILDDIIRVAIGVDFIEEYKSRLKRVHKNKDFIDELSIQFRIIPRTDKKFKEKEEMYHERHRNGSGSSGTE